MRSSLKPLLVLLFCMLFCAGCVHKQIEPPRAQIGKYNFAYDITKQRSTELIQVFDDGASTYLQFHVLPNKPALRTPTQKKPLKYRTDGSLLIVQGTYPNLTLRVSGKETLITKRQQEASLNVSPAKTSSSK